MAGDAGEDDLDGDTLRDLDLGEPCRRASGARSMTSRDSLISAAAAVVPGVINEGSLRRSDERV